METSIVVDNVSYLFVTENGETAFKVITKTTESRGMQPELIKLPAVWVVTRNNGTPLFGLRPKLKDKPFRILTAEKLYAEKIQWFEPLAHFYRELIWVSPGSEQSATEAYRAYKHVTWKEVVDFAIVDRLSLSFYSGFPGDWKGRAKGGDDYLLVFLGGKPYWTDGIGQIPYAVNTFRTYWRESKQIDLAIRKTVETGIKWGDGKAFTGPDERPQDVYDNFIILRGSLWASENFKLTIKKQIIYDKGLPRELEISHTAYSPTSLQRLTSSISQGDVDKYGVWQ